MKFEQKEYTALGTLIIMFCLGNIVNSTFSLIAIVYLYLYIFLTNKNNALYMVFYLIPNIRIADGIGWSSLINIAFLIVGLKWIIKDIQRVNKYGFGMAIVAFVFSTFNSLSLLGNTSYIISVINICVDIIILVAIFDIKDETLDVEKCVYYLVIGVVSSMVIFVISTPNAITEVFSSNYRVAGYGDDPNYFSIYILVGVSLLLLKMLHDHTNYFDYISIFLLVLVGLFTSSKMFFLCLLGIFLLFVFAIFRHNNMKGFKSLIIILLFLGIICFVFSDTITMLLEKVISRFSIISNSSHSTIYTLTTGRSSILSSYWHIFWNDISVMMFGRGLSYNTFLAPLFGDTRVAHNTYFDMLLSWGVLGTILFITVFYLFIKNKVLFKQKRTYTYVPVMIFMITLFSLSCLTADMFWYMLLLVLLPLSNPNND